MVRIKKKGDRMSVETTITTPQQAPLQSQTAAPQNQTWNLVAGFNRASCMAGFTLFNLGMCAVNGGSPFGALSALAAGLCGYSAIRSFAEGLKEPVATPRSPGPLV
jgi:hypothetical protein